MCKNSCVFCHFSIVVEVANCYYKAIYEILSLCVDTLLNTFHLNSFLAIELYIPMPRYWQNISHECFDSLNMHYLTALFLVTPIFWPILYANTVFNCHYILHLTVCNWWIVWCKDIHFRYNDALRKPNNIFKPLLYLTPSHKVKHVHLTTANPILPLVQ